MWRMWLAALLLIAGVACVSGTAETGNPLWTVAGGLMLIFVPALIIDAAARRR